MIPPLVQPGSATVVFLHADGLARFFACAVRRQRAALSTTGLPLQVFATSSYIKVILAPPASQTVAVLKAGVRVS